MLIKILHELLSGGTVFVGSENFNPVPIAHVIGAAIGIIAGVATQRRQIFREIEIPVNGQSMTKQRIEKTIFGK